VAASTSHGCSTPSVAECCQMWPKMTNTSVAGNTCRRQSGRKYLEAVTQGPWVSWPRMTSSGIEQGKSPDQKWSKNDQKLRAKKVVKKCSEIRLSENATKCLCRSALSNIFVQNFTKSENYLKMRSKSIVQGIFHPQPLWFRGAHQTGKSSVIFSEGLCTTFWKFQKQTNTRSPQKWSARKYMWKAFRGRYPTRKSSKTEQFVYALHQSCVQYTYESECKKW
jgi:hypothetical protein